MLDLFLILCSGAVSICVSEKMSDFRESNLFKQIRNLLAFSLVNFAGFSAALKLLGRPLMENTEFERYLAIGVVSIHVLLGMSIFTGAAFSFAHSRLKIHAVCEEIEKGKENEK